MKLLTAKNLFILPALVLGHATLASAMMIDCQSSLVDPAQPGGKFTVLYNTQHDANVGEPVRRLQSQKDFKTQTIFEGDLDGERITPYGSSKRKFTFKPDQVIIEEAFDPKTKNMFVLISAERGGNVAAGESPTWFLGYVNLKYGMGRFSFDFFKDTDPDEEGRGVTVDCTVSY